MLEEKPINAMKVEKPLVKIYTLLDLTGLTPEINLMNINEGGGSFPMTHPVLNIREFIPNRDLMDVMNLLNLRGYLVDKKPYEFGTCRIL